MHEDPMTRGSESRTAPARRQRHGRSNVPSLQSVAVALRPTRSFEGGYIHTTPHSFNLGARKPFRFRGRKTFGPLCSTKTLDALTAPMVVSKCGFALESPCC